MYCKNSHTAQQIIVQRWLLQRESERDRADERKTHGILEIAIQLVEGPGSTGHVGDPSAHCVKSK